MAMLADFSERIDLPSGPVWPAFGEVSRWLAPPTHVTIAHPDATPPMFHLSLIRSDTPDQPPHPFGMLDLTLAAQGALNRTLSELREIIGGITVFPAQLDRAELGLGWEAGSEDSETQAGVSAVWQAGGQARIMQQMDLTSALALAGQLEAGASPLILRGAASIRGVSPRLPCVAMLEAALSSDLAQEMGGVGFTRDTLAFALLSMGVIGLAHTDPELGADHAAALAQALADRIQQEWCVKIGQTPSNLPLYSFVENIESAVWDLSRPYATSRWLPLDQSHATPLADHIRDHGTGQIISRRILPRFPKGQHQITAYANMPLEAPGVHMLNVSLLARATPPNRPSAAHAAGQIDPVTGLVTVDLKLALGEELSYHTTCFAVIGDGADIRQVTGAPFKTRDQILTLSAKDFGLQILQHRVDPGLLAMADLTLVQRTHLKGVRVDTSYALSNATLITVLPADVTNGSLHLTARETGGLGEISLPALPLAPLDITMAMFPSHGRQDILIKMEPAPSGVVGVDVLPGRDGEGNLQTFAFTKDQNERHFIYNATSLFESGFRWRFTGMQVWHYHGDPTKTLQLSAKA